MSEGGTDGGDPKPDPGAEDAEAALGAAVDDVVRAEAKRQFMARFLGVDRAEGTGRGEEHWNESLRRDHLRDLGADPDGPDD
ncbi:hypothetical protein ACQPX6_15820 [Actinomycetospora sp. CA-101289]|uniref:hypothetical protein n=1 Tax=Actinomycetospora sp. CA-101289 TaxID=3239893 RepID=UPI003D98AADE